MQKGKSICWQIIIVVFLLGLTSSCQPIMKAMVGINDIKYLSTEKIIKQSKKYHIPDSNLYVLNDTAYLSFIKTYEGKTINGRNTFKDLYQPLQIYGFDSTDIIQFQLINCTVGGFPNLKWDRYGDFKTSPLNMPRIRLSDSTLLVNTLTDYYSAIGSTPDAQSNCNDETIIVYWNKFMGRQSKRLIKTVNDYRENVNSNACMYYVNTDNLFYMMNQDTSKTK